LSHVTDVACLSESEVMVHASLTGPVTISRVLQLFFVLFLLFRSSVVGVTCPLVSKLHFVWLISWICLYNSFSFSLSLFLLFFSQFGLWHMFWFSNVVIITFIFFASVALISSFKVVILALGALPASFWEGEKWFSSLWWDLFFSIFLF